MEKLSAKEFDANFEAVNIKFSNALKKVGKTKEKVILLDAKKTVDIDTINYAISKGVSYVAENKVQELSAKHLFLSDVHEHFIGHLQTNKVKDVVGVVELIQSVDSFKSANEISKQSLKLGIVTNILLEVNNDYLIFNRIQLSLSYFPYIPGHGRNIIHTNNLRNNHLQLQQFYVGQPSTVSFQ